MGSILLPNVMQLVFSFDIQTVTSPCKCRVEAGECI
nr:MAG TPA: hypothetical protein [Caudoviricetes sp.]